MYTPLCAHMEARSLQICIRFLPLLASTLLLLLLLLFGKASHWTQNSLTQQIQLASKLQGSSWLPTLLVQGVYSPTSSHLAVMSVMEKWTQVLMLVRPPLCQPSHLSILLLLFWHGVFHWHGTWQFNYACWPVSSRDPPDSTSPVVGWQVHTTMSHVLIRALGIKLSLCAWLIQPS